MHKRQPSLLGESLTPSQFRARRRQKFLTLADWGKNQAWHATLIAEAQREMTARQQVNDPQPVAEGVVFDTRWQDLLLAYTAGEPITTLAEPFRAVVRAFARWHVGYGSYMQARQLATGRAMRTDATPMAFDDLESFQLAISLVSFATLLGDGEMVQELAEWLGRYRGEDMLFEALIEPAVRDPRAVEEFFHPAPYDPLLDAVFTADTPSQASAFVKQYLDGWYRAFDGCSWHDAHLVHKDHMSPYNGYWAFEAAAICVIHDIDDTPFRDHLVYPKDLADWARGHDAVARMKAAASQRLDSGETRVRCEAGQPCPRTGFWFTTARAESRQRFVAGQTMPEIADARWGATIWYWHEDQSSNP